MFPHLHFSTLEKTRIDHNPFVNGLILTFHTKTSPGLRKLKKTRTKAFLRSKFIISRDLAVTRPSPDSRFAIAAVQAVELKWLKLNKHKR